ncbi:glutaminyl-tRNA synthase (glutamine-hydrolyzing) subunit B [Candidatus Wirthbacteria bacterium CG2_30_54_11]|uniref:Aspartyl/glutamyl-tRNA(Asn/Gln) amidotransferase subunit B n=1 Tax=Candidatus Wirthbacteria bacterium CG2_30_54_11 TaxID=1817892 RepID=A0A1J5IS16_9BACT|nr:MAG: glutaminyl-tRNA synthase (glutamine-hydrolyzing) subunit B [Candidatus Wirthbacteria bacterium CG2_30_54_11]
MSKNIPIIGLEIHTQLKTVSKMFCRCQADYFGAEPNTHTCPVCLGLPGALPVANQKAIEQTIRVGLALNCSIPEESKFDRKNYFYPDLVKGYQISQYDQPFCVKGYLEVDPSPSAELAKGGLASPLGIVARERHALAGGQNPLISARVRIGITRAHLEEDTAKSLHETDPKTGESYTLIDCNKSGIPLLEIVSDPDMHTIEEASAYARKVRQIVRYIGASDADMDKGQLRFDINVSISPDGDFSKYTPIVEVKNLNSFIALEKALAYEIDRQITQYEATGELYTAGSKETRGWDDVKGVTVHQRSKEEANDYRYFPEPDLPPVHVDPAWVAKLHSELPELPEAKKDRFVEQYGLKDKDAVILVDEQANADWFESAVGDKGKEFAQEVVKWLNGDITFVLRELEIELTASKLKPEYVSELVELIRSGAISGKIAKDILPEVVRDGVSPVKLVEDKGLKLVSDTGILDKAVQEVILENAAVVEQIRSGKEGAIMFLVGQVMKKTRGQANPPVVQELLRQAILSS